MKKKSDLTGYNHLLVCPFCGGTEKVFAPLVCHGRKMRAADTSWKGGPFICFRCQKTVEAAEDTLLPVFTTGGLFQ